MAIAIPTRAVTIDAGERSVRLSRSNCDTGMRPSGTAGSGVCGA